MEVRPPFRRAASSCQFPNPTSSIRLLHHYRYTFFVSQFPHLWTPQDGHVSCRILVPACPHWQHSHWNSNFFFLGFPMSACFVFQPSHHTGRTLVRIPNPDGVLIGLGGVQLILSCSWCEYERQCRYSGWEDSMSPIKSASETVDQESNKSLLKDFTLDLLTELYGIS